MTFGFVFGRKWLTSFVFVSVSAENKITFSAPVSFSAENKITFSAPVSFSAENVYTGFGQSLAEWDIQLYSLTHPSVCLSVRSSVRPVW